MMPISKRQILHSVSAFQAWLHRHARKLVGRCADHGKLKRHRGCSFDSTGRSVSVLYGYSCRSAERRHIRRPSRGRRHLIDIRIDRCRHDGNVRVELPGYEVWIACERTSTAQGRRPCEALK